MYMLMRKGTRAKNVVCNLIPTIADKHGLGSPFSIPPMVQSPQKQTPASDYTWDCQSNLLATLHKPLRIIKPGLGTHQYRGKVIEGQPLHNKRISFKKEAKRATKTKRKPAHQHCRGSFLMFCFGIWGIAPVSTY